MFQVRIHGQGGQGVVTAAELLSVAAFLEGKHAQAFPSFGSERTGSPIVSFCRIDDKQIRLREPILEPDGLRLTQLGAIADRIALKLSVRDDKQLRSWWRRGGRSGCAYERSP
jgi:2-oxoacid:acceptor oxidoreductase gamma subunit (pyruvate/2-ketoisovalerate family)